jgi:hypothetical protein
MFQEFIQATAESFLKKKMEAAEEKCKDHKSEKSMGKWKDDRGDKSVGNCVDEKDENSARKCKDDRKATLLDRWLSCPLLDTKDVMTGIAEFLLAGIGAAFTVALFTDFETIPKLPMK